MAIFNSYVKLPEGTPFISGQTAGDIEMDAQRLPPVLPKSPDRFGHVVLPMLTRCCLTMLWCYDVFLQMDISQTTHLCVFDDGKRWRLASGNLTELLEMVIYSWFTHKNDWLVVYLPLWKIWVRQLGWLFPIYGKIKFMFQTTNQMTIFAM